MPSSEKLSGGWARRNARISSANACCSAVKPNSMASARQGDERIPSERIEEHPLHALHRFGTPAFEPEREIRVGVRGPHEPPAVGEQDTRAVDVDGLVASLELAGELTHHLELP